MLSAPRAAPNRRTRAASLSHSSPLGIRGMSGKTAPDNTMPQWAARIFSGCVSETHKKYVRRSRLCASHGSRMFDQCAVRLGKGRYGVQDTPAGAPVGAPSRTAGEASL